MFHLWDQTNLVLLLMIYCLAITPQSLRIYITFYIGLQHFDGLLPSHISDLKISKKVFLFIKTASASPRGAFLLLAESWVCAIYSANGLRYWDSYAYSIFCNEAPV